MKVIKFLLRVISFVYVVVFVLPTVIAYLFFYHIFEFLNSFAYHNFLDEDPPEEVNNALANHNIYHPTVIKIIVMFISPPVRLFLSFREAIKSIKF
jgi:hypothetical protein